MKQRKRRCPNEDFAKKYASKLSIYYDNVEVIKQNGIFFVSYTV